MEHGKDYSKALFICQPVQWGLYGIEFRKLRAVGDTYKHSDIITKDDDVITHAAGSDSNDLKRIITLCGDVRPENIYEHFGKKAFRTQKAFFEKADDKMKRYVKSASERRICECVNLVAKLNIPIFFKPKPGEYIDQTKELEFIQAPTPLYTFYRKVDDGLDYRLTVGNKVCPSKHKTVIISNTPPLFCIDRKLLHFDDSLNANLLRPFIAKEWMHIPQRMEAEYLRKMILKIASKIDIEAEGFNVDELHPDGHGLLSLERNITGSYQFTLSFEYDGKTFSEKSKREKVVTMHDDGNDISFICINRNRKWEAGIRNFLDEELHLPQHGKLSEMLAWARDNQEALEARQLTVEQLTTKKYYIGDVHISHDESRRGDWFQMHIVLNFDNGISVPLTDMRQELINGEKEFMLPNKEWFIIPDEWLSQYSPLMLFGQSNKKDGSVKVHRSQEEVINTLNFNTVKERKDKPEDYTLPQGLNAKLRKYQEEGYRWLLGHYYGGTGCCLSDDMGLGKTVQSIALILKYEELSSHLAGSGNQSGTKSAGAQLSLFSDEEMGGQDCAKALPVLVLAPASVVYNWRNEIKKFAPSLKVMTYTGTPAERVQKRRNIYAYDVVVTTYATMRNDIDRLALKEWGMTFFDESQVFKNTGTQIYEATRRLHSPCRIALSGTPMENNLQELWALMSILNPSLLGDAKDFRTNFINPISENLKSKNTEMLRKLVEPYFLRRTKAEVLDSLPERQDEIVYCDMTPEQASLYTEVQSRTRNLLLQDSDKVNNISVITTIMRLRQIACAPSILGNNIQSGKLEEVYSRMEELRGTSHKVLVFSEFVSLLNIVAKELKHRGWAYTMLTGETRNRERIINDFQTNPNCQFFLISLDAGGVGLNLTEADYVFLLDPWWNKNKEEQAISRAHRQGQRRSVFVYKFISSGTLEEDILGMQQDKQSLIDAVLSCLSK